MTRTFAYFVFACLLLVGCDQDSPPPATASNSAAAPLQRLQPRETVFPLSVGQREIQVQLAITGPEQQTGLMNRRTLGENHGMIFIFSQPAPRSFWMKNTLIPLDIAYINPAGVIEEIYPMEPLDETSIPSRSRNIQFALEMNQGWFEAYGVQTGDSINLQQLAAAMAARGFDADVIAP